MDVYGVLSYVAERFIFRDLKDDPWNPPICEAKMQGSNSIEPGSRSYPHGPQPVCFCRSRIATL